MSSIFKVKCTHRKLPGCGNDKVKNVEGCENDDHEKHGVDGGVPVKVATANIQYVGDLEDDELEHCAGEGKVDAKDELNDIVVELVVPEQHLDEKYPTDEEEDDLSH